ncbi:MarR family transcriptional regulator [Ureibacillus composti]|uniref:MarR family transcriptional regulator n=1 Tax=Lysinibacillus composti TaxID=720633 RepID=A0A3N9UJN1_9BACI|nr:MarR family transcriptional regulator [Lysinibacillus composti]MBM7607195.1 MarR family 2-MHQ and catechol resistance regulon transcriptional repressor [Lysinibacillus composti]MDM5334401.1 MarR family transcriptional regulator [Ureibacillus composti]RQW76223.1 MarR family transcriptional regulator [Lysinibacillus composti]
MEINEKLKAFTVLLRSAQSVQDATKKDIAKYNLNQTEFAVLELLYHKGDQPIQVIGKKILIASSSITYVVDKLEEKNYVTRRACPTDRRVTYAGITENGKELMDKIFPEHVEKIEEIFDKLSDQEVSTLIDYLKKVGLHANQL